MNLHRMSQSLIVLSVTGADVAVIDRGLIPGRRTGGSDLVAYRRIC
jgi:hypothetical protein